MAASIPCKPAWRALRRFEWLILVILGLLALHSLSIIIEGNRLESKLAELKAEGQKLSCAECAPPKVPTNRNGAVIYALAFKLLDAQGFGDQKHLASDLPIPESLTRATHQSTPALWAKVRHRLADYSEIPGLVERAEARPSCRFPIRWEDGFLALLPHEARLRELDRILCADALVAAKDGNMDSALRYLKLAMRLQSANSTEPAIVSQLVRMALLTLTLNTLDEIATPAAANSPRGRELAKELAGIDVGDGFLPAFRNERAAGIQIFDNLQRGVPMDRNTLVDPDSSKNWGETLWIGGYARRPVLYADELSYLQGMDREIATANLPWRLRSQTDRAFESRIPRYATLTRLLMPSFTEVARKRDMVASELAGSRLLLALLRFRAQTGAYPSNLESLSGVTASQIIDPYSGEPFSYHAVGRGFILKSDRHALPEPPTTPQSEVRRSADRSIGLTWQRDS